MRSLNSLFPIMDSISACRELLKKQVVDHTKVAVISDSQIYSTFGKELMDGINHYYLLVPEGEEAKKVDVAYSCWNTLFEHGLDRDSLIIAVGGGAITDLAGFVASCYLRGIAFINVPTTLLGMVDAAVGGKTGVNTPNGKNTLGTFYYPKQVIVALEFLKTLPEREYRSGLAEIIKYGVILDPAFFQLLEDNVEKILNKDPDLLGEIIAKCMNLKYEITVEDPYEKSERAILNWGHTFGHALEKLTDYKEYTHGEAIAIGMHCAAHLSYQLEMTDQLFVERQKNLIEKFGLPTELPDVNIDALIEQMTQDKKSSNQDIYLVLAKNLGDVAKLGPITKEQIKSALEKM